MKRRGARVVSSSSAVVPAVEAGTNSVSTSAATTATASISSSPVDVVSATKPVLTIPTLNIFARFQSHRDDFDADWLLLKEDPVTGEEKPPLAAHVADKLRRHQAQLGAHRAAAAADRTAALKGKQNTSGTGRGEENEDGAEATPVPAPSRRQRRPDTYDSAEDEVSTPVVADLEGKVEESVSEEGDYVPEDRKAAQYRHAKKAARKATSPLPAVKVEDTAPLLEVASSVFVEETVAAENVEENEGLIGDYLNFESTTPSGGKALAAGELQATVHMPSMASANTTLGSTMRGAQQQQQQQQQQRRYQRGGEAGTPAEDRVVVVPLWSTARMEQHGGYCRTNPVIALHQEVTDLVDFLRPTEAEVTMRRYIEKEIGKLVDRLWPGSSVLVYGSMHTHLLLPLSDLDMTLLDVPVPAEEALTALAKEISNENLCEGVYPQVILKTKVPLIKFAHKGSLIDVDISVGAVDGKRNSECVIRYLNTYPEALPLVMTIKYFLMQRGMHEPYHGGLGSYAATLLVIAFLRQHPIYTTHPEQRAMTGLGKLLVDFLRMCGQFWNYARVAVSLDDLQISNATGGATVDAGDFHARSDLEWGSRMQSPVSPSSPRTPMGPAQGSIEDPVDSTNNAASSLRLFHSVSSMFTYAYVALTADFTAAEGLDSGPASAQVSSPSNEDISKRPTLLSRIFHVDPDMIFHRQAVATTYERLSTEMPAYMAEVRQFHREEDAAMLPSSGQSWREHRQQQRRSGGSCPFLWETAPPRVVTSLEERLALAHLHEASTPPPTAPERETGNPWKRLRGSADGDDDEVGSQDPVTQKSRRVEKRAGETRSLASSSSSSASSGTSRGYDSDSESNASSVRVDVTRRTERSRRMRRD